MALQQIEAGRISLDTPVKRSLPDFDGPDVATLRHLLTHTSEGEVGAEYVYSSSRYARVGDLLQAASGQSFERLLRAGVLEPAGLRFYDSPQLGAHAGLVSTVDEMAKLLQALDAGRVLTRGGPRAAGHTLAFPRRGPVAREPRLVRAGRAGAAGDLELRPGRSRALRRVAPAGAPPAAGRSSSWRTATA